MRRLALSDFHFGAPGALGSQKFVLERLEPEFDWADEVVICGDLFTLLFANWQGAVEGAKPFLNLLQQKVESVVFLPGNHDYHFAVWEDNPNQTISARLPRTEDFLSNLIPGVKIHAAYPHLTLDSVTYMHGHLVSALAYESGLQPIDGLLWRLQAIYPKKLQPADYEALLAPYYELAYQQRNLYPSSPVHPLKALLGNQGQGAGVIATFSPAKMLLASLGRTLNRKFGFRFRPKPLSAKLELLAHVCQTFQVPEGPVVYAHTHIPHDGRRASRNKNYLFYNTGSWHYEKHLLEPDYDFAHPGTVIRVEDGTMLRKNLLSDVSAQTMHDILGL